MINADSKLIHADTTYKIMGGLLPKRLREPAASGLPIPPGITAETVNITQA